MTKRTSPIKPPETKQNTSYNTPEIMGELSNFLSLIADIWLKRVTTSCEKEEKLANPKK